MRTHSLFGLIVVLLAMLTASAGALAQQQATAVVAVINMQQVMSSAAAAKDGARQINVYRSRFRDEIAKEEETLRAEEQELTRQQAILAPNVFEQKRRDFQRNVAKVQLKVKARRKALKQVEIQARTEVGKVIEKIVNEFAEKRKFNLVIDRSVVLFRAESLDITKDLLVELDKRLPTITVAEPKVQ